MYAFFGEGLENLNGVAAYNTNEHPSAGIDGKMVDATIHIW
jgi:hypothetical protein